MSRLGIQSARIVPHSGVEAKCRPGRANKVSRFPHLKFAYNNLKCIKINVKPRHPGRPKKADLGGKTPVDLWSHAKNAYYRNVK